MEGRALFSSVLGKAPVWLRDRLCCVHSGSLSKKTSWGSLQRLSVISCLCWGQGQDALGGQGKPLLWCLASEHRRHVATSVYSSLWVEHSILSLNCVEGWGVLGDLRERNLLASGLGIYQINFYFAFFKERQWETDDSWSCVFWAHTAHHTHWQLWVRQNHWRMDELRLKWRTRLCPEEYSFEALRGSLVCF